MYPLYLIALMPLLGALINGATALHVAYWKKNPSEKWVSFIGVIFPVLSFAFALNAAWPFLFHEVSTPRIETLFSWIHVGALEIDLAFRVDRLASMMILIVTGVGSLIHLYSSKYMHGDKGFARYFTYLNLFLFSMLLLVLGNNLLVLFIGWEGVGLCSYFLIGFWFEDAEKASAGKKAFIVNRIGDFGFLAALFIIASILLKNPQAAASGIFNFDTLEQYKGFLAPAATAITLLLFLGATGKSAQIPLYVWLPDAMAGPTPVSALIHAATMVTAGVYMVARMSFLFDLAPFSREVVASVGAITAIFAATIGIVQRDIKKVLAYSTVSQLGYMFLGVGIGANVAGVFHLMTHAFFKACLFLGSGSVIHAMHHEQDILKMGGLKKWMPITFITFFISTLAIAGIPPFAGFFSKDEILWQAFSRGYQWQWFLGFLAAGMTAFYMFRLVALTFLGKTRVDHHTQEHLHESPWQMTTPLILLALLAVFAGFLGVPHALGGHNLIHEWLNFDGGVSAEHGEELTHLEQSLAGISVAWAVFWSALALYLYTRKTELMNRLALRLKSLHQLLFNKYYVDEIYECLFVKPLQWISQKVLWKGVDANVIDGLVVNGAGKASEFFGRLFGLLQTGVVNHYAFYFLLGLVGLIYWVLQ
ncbi:MAG: NADH-quinone oxidoreductase subunit L [Deltaproteobacteria bacterium]|nr:NADH-quinone oxidoreductase subunit L [Deltaproteobacteria bacterium]